MEPLINNFLKWCVSDSGKKFCRFFAGATNVGIFSALCLPHSILLKNYRDLVHLYADGKPSSIPDDIKTLFNEVLDDLKIQEVDRKYIEPFMVIGIDTFQAGMVEMNTGAVVGIPLNFTFTHYTDAERLHLLINTLPLDWARKETETLAETLIMSQEAKKFAIAREIRMFQESGKFLNCILAFVFFTISYIFCQMVKKKYNLYEKSLSSRIFLYSVVGITGLMLYFTQKDFLHRRTEQKIDLELSQINPSYMKGGYEFYTKLLQRNIAHRSLLDNYGSELYKEDGNPAYYIRQKTTPITKRKSFFEAKITNFVQDDEKNVISELRNLAVDVETT